MKQEQHNYKIPKFIINHPLEEEEEEEEEEIILFDTYLSIVTDNIYKVNRTTVSGDYN